MATQELDLGGILQTFVLTFIGVILVAILLAYALYQVMTLLFPSMDNLFKIIIAIVLTGITLHYTLFYHNNRSLLG